MFLAWLGLAVKSKNTFSGRVLQTTGGWRPLKHFVVFYFTYNRYTQAYIKAVRIPARNI